MNNDEFIELVSYVSISTYRERVLNSIAPWGTPKMIAEKASIRQNHVSNVLRQLKQRGLVVCINEDAHKGRVYKLTDLGVGVVTHLSEMN